MAARTVLEPAAGVLVLPSGDRRLELSLRCPDVRLNQAGTFGGDLPTQIARRAERPTDGTAPTFPSGRSPRSLRWNVNSASAVVPAGASAAQMAAVVVRGDSSGNSRRSRWRRLRRSDCAASSGPVRPRAIRCFSTATLPASNSPSRATRVENGKAYLGHRPFCKLEPNTWYESRRAVFGPTPVGR